MKNNAEFHQINAKTYWITCEIDRRLIKPQQQPFINPKSDSKIDGHKYVE